MFVGQLPDLHFRCKNCGANGRASAGDAAGALIEVAYRHVSKTHRVEMWNRGNRKTSWWIEQLDLEGVGDGHQDI